MHAQEQPKYLLKHKQTKAKPAAADCDCASNEEPTEQEPPSNWDLKLRLGSVFQLSANENVIGKANGTTRTVGLDVRAAANWARDGHEVRNRLDVNVVFIKTATTSGWVSATDIFDFENIYQYRVRPWTGPFTRAGMITSLFVGRDLRSNSVQYQYPDGRLTDERTQLVLTDAFRPITFLQTVGGFFNPIREEAFDLDFRGGLGAREVMAGGQLGVSDDSDTPSIVELTQLQSYAQAGLEAIVMARGVLLDNKLQYFAGGEFLLPLVRTRRPGDRRGAVELMDKRARLGIAYTLASWATLLYEIRFVHQPQLLDAVQVQNNVGFKASYSVL